MFCLDDRVKLIHDEEYTHGDKYLKRIGTVIKHPFRSDWFGVQFDGEVHARFGIAPKDGRWIKVNTDWDT